MRVEQIHGLARSGFCLVVRRRVDHFAGQMFTLVQPSIRVLVLKVADGPRPEVIEDPGMRKPLFAEHSEIFTFDLGRWNRLAFVCENGRWRLPRCRRVQDGVIGAFRNPRAPSDLRHHPGLGAIGLIRVNDVFTRRRRTRRHHRVLYTGARHLPAPSFRTQRDLTLEDPEQLLRAWKEVQLFARPSCMRHRTLRREVADDAAEFCGLVAFGSCTRSSGRRLLAADAKVVRPLAMVCAQ